MSIEYFVVLILIAMLIGVYLILGSINKTKEDVSILMEFILDDQSKVVEKINERAEWLKEIKSRLDDINFTLVKLEALLEKTPGEAEEKLIDKSMHEPIKERKAKRGE